jgi:hypothetical protein
MPTIHGHKRVGAKTPEYIVWLGMKRRCYKPRDKDYPRWGGRGIRVSDEWRTSFVSFLRDMGLRPSPKHTIDRIDGNGDYCKENCRWATPKVQRENQSNTQRLVIGGVAFSSRAAACRHFGVATNTAHERIHAGIAPEIAVSTPGRMSSRRTRESYLRKSSR